MEDLQIWGSLVNFGHFQLKKAVNLFNFQIFRKIQAYFVT